MSTQPSPEPTAPFGKTYKFDHTAVNNDLHLFIDGNHNPDHCPECLMPRGLFTLAHQEAIRQAENYGRMAMLADLTAWLDLHEIEDTTMVREFADHVTKSIQQTPSQRYPSHPNPWRGCMSRLLLLPKSTAADPRVEGVCEHCAQHYPVWYAPNEIWNKAMRRGVKVADRWGFLCPTCFTVLAEEQGVVPTAWVVTTREAESEAMRRAVDTTKQNTILSVLEQLKLAWTNDPATAYANDSRRLDAIRKWTEDIEKTILTPGEDV